MKALATGQVMALVSQSHLESHCLASLLFPGPSKADLVSLIFFYLQEVLSTS